MSDTALSVAEVGARLDRLPVSRFHKKLAGLISAGMFFDGFDLFMASGVIAAMVKSGFSNLALNGEFLTATFLGMTIGSFLSGFIGDYFGRRITYQLNLLIFGGASLVAVFLPDMHSLIIARFVMGVGIGAEIVVGYSTYAEFLPPATRGRWQGLMALPFQFSIFLGSLVGLLVIPHFGWRPMFLIAAVGAGIVWYLRKDIPESPRWLAGKGRFAEADKIVRMMESQSGVPENAPVVFARAPVAAARTSFRNPQILLRMFVAVVAVIAVNVVGYGFFTFVPTFLVKEGHSVVQSLTYSTLMMAGGPIGSLIALMINDKVGRRWAIAGSGLISVAFGWWYPYAGAGFFFLVAGFMLVTSHYVNSVSVVAMFMPEQFPTDIRLRANGICHTIGRISAAISPPIVVYFYSEYGIVSVIVMMTVVQLAQAAVVFWGVEATHRSLEDVAVGPTEESSLSAVNV